MRVLVRSLPAQREQCFAVSEEGERGLAGTEFRATLAPEFGVAPSPTAPLANSGAEVHLRLGLEKWRGDTGTAEMPEVCLASRLALILGGVLKRSETMFRPLALSHPSGKWRQSPCSRWRWRISCRKARRA